MSERLRKTLKVDTIAGKVTFKPGLDYHHATITVSVVLANKRHLRQWFHSLAYFALTAKETGSVGDLTTYRVSGPFHGLERLTRLTNVREVIFADYSVPRTDTPETREDVLRSALR